MHDDSIRPLIHSRSFSPAPTFPPTPTHGTMENLDVTSGSVRRNGEFSWVLALSYTVDWAILLAFAVVGYILGDITPNKRPFSLDDRNIAYADLPLASPPLPFPQSLRRRPNCSSDGLCITIASHTR